MCRISGVFPATDPLSPPDVSSGPQVVPDFNPAWTAAWARARNLISGLSVEEKVGSASCPVGAELADIIDLFRLILLLVLVG